MIFKRLYNIGYFLIGAISVLFLHLNCCEASKGDDKERLFLYMRSGNLRGRESDRSYQLAKQFGIDRNGSHLRVRSNLTVVGEAHYDTTKVEEQKEMDEKQVGSSTNSSSSVVETEMVVSAFIPFSTVTTQENSSPSPSSDEAPQKSDEGSPSSSQMKQVDASPKNTTSNTEELAPSLVASSSSTENITSEGSESFAVSSPLSVAPATIKVISKAPTPDSQLLSECGCKRKFYYSLDDFTGSKLNSSCSDEGTQYTPGQKVVSYSLPRATSPGDYNLTSLYKQNIMENLQRMRHFYPGYSMRIYTDLSLDTTYCRFLCQNVDLFWCDIRNSVGGDQSKMLHATWKFLPLGDPSVQLFLSRDISSFINEREAAVVEDWLTVNKTFHVMRDKRRVHNIAMPGGLWGARNDLLLGDEGEKIRAQIIPMSKTLRNKGFRFKNFDQDILSRVIFYPRKKDIVAYDSYHCRQWKRFTMIRPFPVKRNETVLVEGLRLGRRGSASNAVAAIKKKYKLTKCPVECRPSYGKDWDYC